MSNEFELGDRVRVAGYPGIAFTYEGREMVPDEDTEWTGLLAPTGMVEVVMVGDDRVHVVDPDDLTPLADNEYCPECGQIGCTAYPR